MITVCIHAVYVASDDVNDLFIVSLLLSYSTVVMATNTW